MGPAGGSPSGEFKKQNQVQGALLSCLLAVAKSVPSNSASAAPTCTRHFRKSKLKFR